MRTYYIVEHNDKSGQYWRAYKRGFWSTLNSYNDFNIVLSTHSFESADDCESRLRRQIEKPKVVRVIRM